MRAELAVLAAHIIRLPVQTLGDLVVKCDVLAWLLLQNGVVADTEAERYVRWFGRELRRSATDVR